VCGTGTPERVAEQRGHGEPVGQPADHAGLRRRAHDAHPAVVAVVGQEGQQEHPRRRGEQSGGCALGAPQPVAPHGLAAAVTEQDGEVGGGHCARSLTGGR
jgi:hypothetical protein